MRREIVGLIGLIMYGSVVWGQESFVLEGRIKGINDGCVVKLTQWYGVSGVERGSDTIRNGEFLIRGTVENFPVLLNMSITPDLGLPSRNLWIGAGTTRIKGNSADIRDWKIQGRTKEQKEEDFLMKNSRRETEAFEDYYSQNMEAYSAELGDRYLRKKAKMKDYPVSRKIDSLMEQRDRKILGLLEKKKKVSIVGMNSLYELVKMMTMTDGSDLIRKSIQELYDRLDSVQQNSAMGAEINAFIHPCRIVEVGDDMVDGLLLDLKGNEHRLSDYKGKYILLDFWGAHCGACVEALPELDRLRKTYADRLYVVSICLETSREIWQNSAGSLPGIQLSDLKGLGGLVNRYGFVGMPQFVAIGPDGKVLKKWTGYGKGYLEKQLEELWETDNCAGHSPLPPSP